MTHTIPGADIRGYYAALGIHIPEWATVNAAVRCFADPGSHQHDDRKPSASVDLISGAFHCHGCGARGGAYDAALTQGHTPRSAIDLMIAHGLTERRFRLCSARELMHRDTAHGHLRSQPAPRPRLAATEDDVRRWQHQLLRQPNLAMRLARERGWIIPAMRELGLGWDRARITIPIRDHEGTLIGVLRYQSHDTGRPKMLAVPGTRLGLVPHPASEPAQYVMLVEGPPDMIAARSRGLPAIAVPGDHAWRKQWAQPFAGRQVTIVMDADPAGREAARRIHQALAQVADARVHELAPDRDDGYDLTDWLADHPADPASLLNPDLQSTR